MPGAVRCDLQNLFTNLKLSLSLPKPFPNGQWSFWAPNKRSGHNLGQRCWTAELAAWWPSVQTGRLFGRGCAVIWTPIANKTNGHSVQDQEQFRVQRWPAHAVVATVSAIKQYGSINEMQCYEMLPYRPATIESTVAAVCR